MSGQDDHSESVNRYDPSGIEEKHGVIPWWLAMVYAALFVWMIWYTIAFWTDRG